MAPDRPFEQVLADLRRRNDHAALEVYNRFAARLISLARTQLDTHIRRKLDPEDVVQSVMRTLFLRLADGQFALTDWDRLWGLLTRLTIHKRNRQFRHYHTDQRQIDRDARQPSADDTDDVWFGPAPEPTPEVALMLAETLEEVLRGLDELDHPIVVLSLEGYTPAEISDRLGCTNSKVYRALRRVRSRLEGMRDADPRRPSHA